MHNEIFEDESLEFDELDEEFEWEPEPRIKEEILEYMDEAFDKVWLVRTQNIVYRINHGIETIDPEIEKGMWKSVERVCEKYNIDFDEPVSDWEYGYWSGILASLRWVLGDEKDFLDT